MITPGYVHRMAAYNRWQNASLTAAASLLDEQARRMDRGSFFRSIHGTFCHLLWGDQVWMHRFAGTPKPEKASIKESVDLVSDWSVFVHRRGAFDNEIVRWARQVKGHDLAGDLQWWSGALQREVSRPMALLLMHFFNHQTHHRGQLHAMLTAAGAVPEDTDLFVMSEDEMAEKRPTQADVEATPGAEE